MPPEVEGGAAPQADDLVTALGEAYDAAEAGAQEQIPNDPPAEVEAGQEDTDLELSGDEPEDGADPNEDGQPEIAEAPEHWSQEDKDRFNELPDEAKAWWLEKTKSLESGYNGKFQEVAEQRNRFKALEPVLEDLSGLKDQLQLLGTNEAGYLRSLMAADKWLKQDPNAAVQWLAENYKIDLSQFGAQPESDDPEILDPTAAAQIKSLTDKISSLEKQLTTRDQTELNTRQQQMKAAIAEFQNATDEAGNALRPHFEEVKGHMAALLQSGAAKDLQSAYDQALWAHPELRSDLIARQQAEAAKAAAEKRKAENAKAKKASRNVKGDGVGRAQQQPADSWKAELERQFDEAGL